MTEYEYIVIEHDGKSKSGKTDIYTVKNKKSNALLGTILWQGGWRQYVFLPYAHTIYSAGCMKDIASFIEEIMTERKVQRASL